MSNFKPITVTIETEAELLALWGRLNVDSYNGLISTKLLVLVETPPFEAAAKAVESEDLYRIWDKLDDFIKEQNIEP